VTRLTGRRGALLRRVLVVVSIAAAVHLLAIWAVPRIIMSRLLDGVASAASGGVFLPPMTDASQRRVVMPSPDLLYALCRLELTDRPVRIRADPDPVPLWSIALYGANSDNFFVLNDREAQGAPVDIVLLPPATGAAGLRLPDGARVLPTPGGPVLLLMRLLVTDYEREQSTLERARQSLRCERL
jgi:uncharacterized membrane protein